MNQNKIQFLAPIHLKKWIDENRHLLKPPVGNRQIWEDRDFMVTVVGGPNSRSDFHINEGEEFFYQLEGTITLRILDESGDIREVLLEEGDIFLLPPRVPHSPQRPEGTVGLVLERKRLPHEMDSFLWICKKCGRKLHQETLHITHIVTQLPPLFERFYGNKDYSTCKSCGTRAQKN
jgi:3-hydroxyanthranilate 3,4-dioxygenase